MYTCSRSPVLGGMKEMDKIKMNCMIWIDFSKFNAGMLL